MSALAPAIGSNPVLPLLPFSLEHIVQNKAFFLICGQARVITVSLALLFGILFPSIVTGTAAETIVAAGGAHALALADDGAVWAWGFNDQGQLGDGSLQYTTSPVQIQG